VDLVSRHTQLAVHSVTNRQLFSYKHNNALTCDVESGSGSMNWQRRAVHGAIPFSLCDSTRRRTSSSRSRTLADVTESFSDVRLRTSRTDASTDSINLVSPAARQRYSPCHNKPLGVVEGRQSVVGGPLRNGTKTAHCTHGCNMVLIA